MAITFDPAAKRIILDSASVTAEEIFSRWEDWALLSDNVKYGAVMTHVGGNPLSGGRFVPNYFFLENGWRIRPMEANHVLVITGNIDTTDGGQPVVNTLGNYNVSTQYTVPVQAQGIATEGGSGPSAESIASAVLAAFKADPSTLTVPKFLGLK